MKVKVLFLAANPISPKPLALDEEIRAITQKIRAAEHRDLIEVIQAHAVRADDLQDALLQHQPQIVHFSGHGTSANELVLLDNSGQPKPLSQAALVSLFKALKDNIQVVVLNACYSAPQAEAITAHIPCAIGMSDAIRDDAAGTFASSFYRALAYGRSVQTAFDLGVQAIEGEGIPQEHIPHLRTQQGVEAADLVVVNPT